MARQQWIVTLRGDRPLAEVRKDLGASGFEIDQVLEEIGVLTGTADGEAVAKLRALAGVADVAPNTDIHIGPPGKGDTW